MTTHIQFIVYRRHGDRATYMCPFGQHPKDIHIVTVGSEAHCLRYMIMGKSPERMQ